MRFLFTFCIAAAFVVCLSFASLASAKTWGSFYGNQNNVGTGGSQSSSSSNAPTSQDSQVFPPAGCTPTNSLIAWTGSGNTYCTKASYPVCQTGEFLTFNGTSLSCVDPSICTSNWTTTSTGTCSATCGGGTQNATQSDGCGNTQTISQACNTQACAASPSPPSPSPPACSGGTMVGGCCSIILAFGGNHAMICAPARGVQ